MRRAALFVVILILLVAGAFFPGWNWVYGVLTPKGRPGNFSQLNFKSTNGAYDIYIDGEKKASAKDKEEQIVPQIKPGFHSVKLVRSSRTPGFFYTLERSIEFIPAAQVEIKWEAGPTLESSSGTVKYFSQINKSGGSDVYILPFPKNATVEFDSRRGDANVFEVLDTATHTIKVSNGSGFETQTVQVNLIDETTNHVLTNLKLVVEVYLYKQPFK